MLEIRGCEGRIFKIKRVYLTRRKGFNKMNKDYLYTKAKFYNDHISVVIKSLKETMFNST